MKRLQYLIKWKGYPESDNTWEPADQVHAPELVKHYQSARVHQSSAAYPQSATSKTHQSAPSRTSIRTLRVSPYPYIECPTIFPASLSNAFQKTSLSRTSPSSNAPSTTSTPPNPAPTAYSAFATNLERTTYQYIAGIVNCPTAPFITVTSPCRISLAMSPQSPISTATEGPLPRLSSIRLLKTSPRRSQPPSPHVPEYLDSLLPLPMLQYPPDPPPPRTTSSPSDKCRPAQSAPPSPATSSPPTPTGQSSTGSSSPPKPAPSDTAKTSPPKKRTTKRSWMTMKRRSSFLKPASSGISTASPSLLMATSRTVASQRSLSPVVEGSQTQPNGSKSLMMVEWRGTPPRTALTTSCTCARSMHPPSIQLTLQSLYPIGSTKPFKGLPPLTPPSSTPSKPPTTGDWRPMLCDSEPSTSASSPTRPNSIAPTASSKEPSSPETSAGAVWSAHVLESGFHIWRENRYECPPTP